MPYATLSVEKGGYRVSSAVPYCVRIGVRYSTAKLVDVQAHDDCVHYNAQEGWKEENVEDWAR